jgi:hypothetical protein
VQVRAQPVRTSVLGTRPARLANTAISYAIVPRSARREASTPSADPAEIVATSRYPCSKSMMTLFV